MQNHVEFACPVHADLDVCPDALISYSNRFNEYGLRIHDGGGSCELIEFCPFCGSQLPDSMRDRWFAELEAAGYEDALFRDDLPEAYNSGAWYQTAT